VIWLLDTNVLIHAVRGRPPGVRAHLQQQGPDDVAVSRITAAELWYGAEKSADPGRKREAWAMVLAAF
jgi:tRNA(fMet)-specific endonuclease VapC